MEAKDISRLFVSSYSALGCKWVSDGFNRLNSKDMLLFFNEGTAPPNEKTKMQIESLEKKDQAVVYEVGELIDNEDNIDLKMFILNKIEKFATSETYVVFMCWAEMYRDLCEQVDLVTKQHNNYKNVKYIKKEQRSSSMSQMEANSKEAEIVADALSSLNTPVAETNQIGKNIGESKKEAELNSASSVPPNNGAHNKHPPTGFRDEQDKNNTVSRFNNQATREKLSSSSSRRKTAAEPEVEEDIETIEARIFQESVDEQKVERGFSEIAQAKAQYVDALFQRLVSGIKKYMDLSQEEEPDDKQYLEFVLVLLKVDNYEDFQTCWNAVGNKNFHVILNDEAFSYLREEAVYYSRSCEMIYEKDKWS